MPLLFKKSGFTITKDSAIRSIVMALFLGVVSLPLVGCDTTNESENNTPRVTVLEDEVIIDESFTYSGTPELYQPSYNIRGTLVPIEEVEITSPYEVQHVELLVNEGDWVEEGQVIAQLQSNIDKSVVLADAHEYITTEVDDPEDDTTDSVTGAVEATLEDAILDSDGLYDAEDPELSYKQIGSAYKKTNTMETESADNSKSNASKNSNTSTAERSEKELALEVDDDVRNKVDDDDSDNNEASQLHKSHKSHKSQNIQMTKNGNQDTIQTTTLFVKAPIAGEVIKLDSRLNEDDGLDTNTALMTIANTRQLQLVGKLPLKTGSQNTESLLSIGQPVYFKIYATYTEFSGQISQVTSEPDKENVVVRAPVIPSSENKAVLEYGMQALMTIEYGQKQLGVRVPRVGIHGANLNSLNQKYTRPVSPINGYVWVIEQDHTLADTPVEIVQYFPESDKFLVHGINNDSLICMADLPKNSAGKTLTID